MLVMCRGHKGKGRKWRNMHARGDDLRPFVVEMWNAREERHAYRVVDDKNPEKARTWLRNKMENGRPDATFDKPIPDGRSAFRRGSNGLAWMSIGNRAMGKKGAGLETDLERFPDPGLCAHTFTLGGADVESFAVK